MDELELLKKDWQNEDSNYPKLTYDEIYKMIHKKSSSIVKWIFYVSVFELVLGLVLTLMNPKFGDSPIVYPKWVEIMSYVSFAIIIYFMFKFFKNYKCISSTNNVKELMKNIIGTRKTVRLYIVINLILAGILFATGLFMGYTKAAGGLEQFNNTAHFGDYALIIAIILVVTVLFIGFAYGIYYLLYGLLLRRLNRNYKELKNLEI